MGYSDIDFNALMNEYAEEETEKWQYIWTNWARILRILQIQQKIGVAYVTYDHIKAHDSGNIRINWAIFLEY